MSGLSGPCLTADRLPPQVMASSAQSTSGFQESLVTTKHGFPGGDIDFEFGLSLVFIKE